MAPPVDDHARPVLPPSADCISHLDDNKGAQKKSQWAQTYLGFVKLFRGWARIRVILCEAHRLHEKLFAC